MKCIIFPKLCNKRSTPYFACQFPMFATNYTTFCAAKHFKPPDLHLSLSFSNVLLHFTDLYLTCCLPLFIYFIFIHFIYRNTITSTFHCHAMWCELWNCWNEMKSRILLKLIISKYLKKKQPTKTFYGFKLWKWWDLGWKGFAISPFPFTLSPQNLWQPGARRCKLKLRVKRWPTLSKHLRKRWQKPHTHTLARDVLHQSGWREPSGPRL